ncbi:hypothetical protein SAY87_003315 [Trapa incisa]|uniref:Uncharacterized protein n=1 Tax=Trapa incisa TaxID=236973 RepID=A0AAN7KIY1_9MYRT|nr:hypothetical protein SAY87_003315 [Trapa incisa]
MLPMEAQENNVDFYTNGHDHCLEHIEDSESGGICERALQVMDELCGSEEGRDKAYCNYLTVALLVKIMTGSGADEYVLFLDPVEAGESQETG